MEFKETAQYIVLVLAMIACIFPFTIMFLPPPAQNNSIVATANFSNRLTSYSANVTAQMQAIFGANSSLEAVVKNVPIGTNNPLDYAQLAFAFGALAGVTLQVAKFLIIDMPSIFVTGVFIMGQVLADYIALLPLPFQVVGIAVSIMLGVISLIVTISFVGSVIEFITGKKL